jgi:hypothetical protein
MYIIVCKREKHRQDANRPPILMMNFPLVMIPYILAEIARRCPCKNLKSSLRNPAETARQKNQR